MRACGFAAGSSLDGGSRDRDAGASGEGAAVATVPGDAARAGTVCGSDRRACSGSASCPGTSTYPETPVAVLLVMC